MYVSVSTVYVTLIRLEEQGLVKSEQGTREPGQVGRPRRIFAVTPEGWDALQASRQALARNWEGVEPA